MTTGVPSARTAYEWITFRPRAPLFVEPDAITGLVKTTTTIDVPHLARQTVDVGTYDTLLEEVGT